LNWCTSCGMSISSHGRQFSASSFRSSAMRLPLVDLTFCRAASAPIKRSSQSARDRASFCASCSAIALMDGFTRTRIATLRAFGLGFFIGLSLERWNADLPRCRSRLAFYGHCRVGRQPGGRNQPRDWRHALLSPKALDMARPSRPLRPGWSARQCATYVQPTTPDANRVDADQACAAISRSGFLRPRTSSTNLRRLPSLSGRFLRG
jgi:hypothetical protein